MVGLASDHSGYDMKAIAKRILQAKGIAFIDVGTYTDKACDYSDYVKQVTSLIVRRDCSHGISFCRSGQGANIAANKVKGILSALTFDEYTAEYAIKHNCCNHFAVPSKYVDEQEFAKMVDVWLRTTFDGGRHFTRLRKTLE